MSMTYYYDTIRKNWSVNKIDLKDGTTDMYFTTPVLSLIKDIEPIFDNNDDLFEVKEIRSIIKVTHHAGHIFKDVPVGATMIRVNVKGVIGRGPLQEIVTKLIILHFDVELRKLFSNKEFTANGLYDYINATTNVSTLTLRPIFKDGSDEIKDPYKLSVVYDFEDDDPNEYTMRSFNIFNGLAIRSWEAADDVVEIKKENTDMKLSGAEFDGDVKTMINIYDALRENWTYKEFTLNGNTRHIYITTPVLSLIGNYEKLTAGVEELYKECDWIDFVRVEWYTGKFEFPNVPKNATVIRIQLKHHTKFKNIENEIALRKVTSFFDDKLREMTEADYFDYIYADMDLATGEIRPVIEDGVIRDPYRLSWVPYADEDEEDYEYDKQHTIRNFKDFDGLTVYSWIPCKTGKEEKVADQESKDAIRPAHYDYKITPLDASFEWFKDLPSDEAILAFNVVKYISRYHKKNGDEDLKKAKTYIDFLLNLRANK